MQALLCSEDDGLGTETDAVLEARLTGYPDPLLVHGDLAGAILRRGWSDLPAESIEASCDASSCVAAAWTSIRTIWGGGRRCSASPIHAGTRRCERLNELRTVRASASELGLKVYPLTR